MQYNYVTVYGRKTFQIADPSSVTEMYLVMDYDDGFIAYINGEEVARANIAGVANYDTVAASGGEAGNPVTFDLSANIHLLQPGLNVLAIEIHNRAMYSPDLSLIPELRITY